MRLLLKKITITTLILCSPSLFTMEGETKKKETSCSKFGSFLNYIKGEFTDNSDAQKEFPFELPEPLSKSSKTARCIKKLLEQSNESEQFLCGVSTSEHQSSQQCTPEICDWSRFAQQHGLTQPTDLKGSMNLWQHYRKYIDFIKDELSLNSFRFSIEWALVQPENEHTFDPDALDHYADMFTYAIKKGITPLVNFHHYTDPCWFMDKDGFEKKENISLYVAFCTKVYQHMIEKLSQDKQALEALQKMKNRNPLFSTFNSPTGYAFRGYHQMSGPPANPEKKGLSWVATVLKNILESHVQTYYALKDTYEKKVTNKSAIQAPQIGLLKNIHQLDPAQDTITQWACKPITRIVCSVAKLLQNKCVYDFFNTGKFNVYIPGALSISHTNHNAQNALDWLGLNTYANRHMMIASTKLETAHEQKTDNPHYRIYPQGLYRAAIELHEQVTNEKGIPLYVTENGIATKDEKKRANFFRAYLYALLKARQAGVNIKGYFAWTLASNYEWPEPDTKKTSANTKQYGLCTATEDSPELTLKDGSQAYVEFAKTLLTQSNENEHTNEH